MLTRVDDEDIIRRQLETSLGLDAVESSDEVEAELQPVEQEPLQESYSRRQGAGYQKVQNKRVFCAEEAKLRDTLQKQKKGTTSVKAKRSTKRLPTEPDTKSSDEEDVSRVEIIMRASLTKREEREKRLKRRLGNKQ